jgi:hypothetical protein
MSHPSHKDSDRRGGILYSENTVVGGTKNTFESVTNCNRDEFMP